MEALGRELADDLAPRGAVGAGDQNHGGPLFTYLQFSAYRSELTLRMARIRNQNELLMAVYGSLTGESNDTALGSAAHQVSE